MPQQFLYSFFKKALFIITAFLLFVLFIDPYGINPWGLEISRVNKIKYERVNIDRLIKPWEVYWKQPKTIFMGTSRPHQSLNPEVLDNSVFAPAYNAAVPASTLEENLLFLKKYFQLNKNIRFVVFDIFWITFFKREDIKGTQYNLETLEFFTQFFGLVFSVESITDCFKTFYKNFRKNSRGYYISSEGFFVYPPNIDSSRHLAGYLQNMHVEISNKIEIDEDRFIVLEEIEKLCKQNGAKLILTILPEPPISDYFYECNNITPLREYVFKRLSHYPDVYYFSALGGLENPNPYWWDPHHPSITVGNMVLESLKSGKPNSTIPDFGVLLVPKNVGKIFSDRKIRSREMELK